jgi:F-type H+-transporting ATPase subunit gamma
MADSLETVRQRIHGVQQLDAVIGAMRGIAAAHAQQSRALLPGFRAYAEVIAMAIAQALRLRGADAPSIKEHRLRRGQIVFCAEHGFAGSFSEHVADAAGPADVVLLIGSRGVAVLEARGIRPVWQTPMATRVSGIAPLCTRIAEVLYRLMPEHQLGAIEAVFPAWQSGLGLRIERRSLLPLDETRFRDSLMGVPPLTTLPPALLLETLAAEYVYAELCQMAMQAFVAENEARVAAMVRARGNVQDMLTALQASERQVRQEAITAELVELAGAIRPPSHQAQS